MYVAWKTRERNLQETVTISYEQHWREKYFNFVFLAVIVFTDTLLVVLRFYSFCVHTDWTVRVM
jgi:hypothetical protein